MSHAVLPAKESMKHRFKKRNSYPWGYDELHFKGQRNDIGRTKQEKNRKPHSPAGGRKPKNKDVSGIGRATIRKSAVSRHK